MIKKFQGNIWVCLLPILVILFSCESPRSASSWDALDANSILVFESRSAPLVLSDRFFTHFFLKGDGEYLSALQKSSKEDFDLLYSFSVERDAYDSILLRLKNKEIVNRVFNGHEILELKSQGNDVQFVFTYLDGVLVLSRSSFLIENAIRVFLDHEGRGFRVKNKTLFQFPSLKSDKGNLYVNIKNLSEISGLGSLLTQSIPLLNDLREMSVYDIKSETNFLTLNGFSLSDNSSLSKFQNQRPTPFKVANYIPNSSDALIHFGISDFQSFKLIDSSFINAIDLGSEIAFCSTREKKDELLAFVGLNSDSTPEFNFITDYNEIYSNFQIRGVNTDVLKRSFEGIFPNVSFSFCTVKDNYLLFSQSLDQIKLLIDAIESEDTWGKTSDYLKFINRGLQESNITLILKRPEIFSGASNSLKRYSVLMDSLGLSRVNWFSMQMSALDNHFYSNVNFSLGAPVLKSSNIKQKTNASSIELPGSIKFASIVKNHITGLQEVLIQDSDLMIYLVSLTDGIQWKRKLDEEIINTIEQIDYYKNGKLQYNFITKSKLHIIDRLGRDVVGFPKSLTADAKFFQLIDYDKTRNYRFLVSSLNNDVSLLDRDGKVISEWGVRKFENTISLSPEHIKIGGKDYFVILLSDWSMQIINRKGDQINLFTLKDRRVISGDFYLEPGMSIEGTSIYYVSIDGEVVKQNLRGEIVSTQNLLRGKNSRFILKRTSNGGDFNFYRIDAEKIVVFDKTGKLLFERQNSGSTNLEFHCFKAEGNKRIFSFYDMDQKLVQIFDEAGNDLIQTPIESEIPPSFGFGKFKSELGVFSFSQKSVAFTTIR